MEANMYELIQSAKSHKIWGVYAALIIMAIPVFIAVIGYVFTAMVLLTTPDSYMEI
jgi:surface polysaccharide O-acyltransferase-like enzyme